MKEEYFEGKSWTQTFASDPVDPSGERYKIDFQICKGNVSVYGRGQERP